MKFTFFGIFLLTASLFASEMCASLCKPCSENPADSTCSRIDSLCHCNALLDSIRQVETSREELQSKATASLAQNIQDSCNTEFCAFQIAFSGDTLSHFQKTKIPVSKKRLKFYKTKQADFSGQKDSTHSESLLSLSDECKNFCAFCPAEKSADSNCIRIENLCGCTAFAEQELRIAEKAKADSMQKLQDFIKRNEQLKATADSIYSYFTESQANSFFVTLRKEDFFLIDIRRAKENNPDTTKSNAIIFVPQDTTAKLGDSLRILPKKGIDKSEKPVPVTANNSKDHWRVLYLGLSLHIGQIYDNGLAGKDVSRNGSVAAGLGVFIRTYFYKYGSFQMGANAVYQYADYDLLRIGYYSDYYFDAGIQYHNLVAEFPLELRFGFPTWKGFCPFFSYNFNIRKPIYAWYNWYVEGYGYDSEYYYKSYGDGWDSWDSSPYEAKDFEFTGYFGFGLEIFRHVSLEFQWLIHSLSTFADDTTEPYDTDDTWQIKLDIAF